MTFAKAIKILDLLDHDKTIAVDCCDLCDSYENHATVELFIFKHSYNLCSKCYNEIRDTFIKCELKEDENEE